MSMSKTKDQHEQHYNQVHRVEKGGFQLAQIIVNNLLTKIMFRFVLQPLWCGVSEHDQAEETHQALSQQGSHEERERAGGEQSD